METVKISETNRHQERESSQDYRETLARLGMQAEEESQQKSIVGLRDVGLRYARMIQGNDLLGRTSLQTMVDDMKNFKDGNVSVPIDLSDF